MIPRKQRLSIYKYMIKLMEGENILLDCSHGGGYILSYGYCWLLIYIEITRKYKNPLNIHNLPELMNYRPDSGWIENNNFWFPHMSIEGVERRLNILKEIVTKMEGK